MEAEPQRETETETDDKVMTKTDRDKDGDCSSHDSCLPNSSSLSPYQGYPRPLELSFGQ